MVARVKKYGWDSLFDLDLHCLLRRKDLSENLQRIDLSENLCCAIVISRRVCITEKNDTDIDR